RVEEREQEIGRGKARILRGGVLERLLRFDPRSVFPELDAFVVEPCGLGVLGRRLRRRTGVEPDARDRLDRLRVVRASPVEIRAAERTDDERDDHEPLLRPRWPRWRR